MSHPRTRTKKAKGGYYFIEQDLIRSGIHEHTSALPDAVSQETLDGLNVVQATPWQINGWLLDTMLEAYYGGARLGDIPYVDRIEPPSRREDDEWLRMSDEEKSEWKRQLSDIHAENARMEGRRHSFLHKLDVAKELRHREAIWFPHSLDFRTRMYPVPQDLHPQSDDIGRSLLRYSRGKRLGDRGLYWLAVRLANTYGQDKLPFDERVEWAHQHHELIMDSGRDPLDGMRFWAAVDENGDCVADEPWCFLATCREWYEAHRLDNPEDYVSHLPIQMDGTCNGLQHLSAMGRDRIGAEATNVAANTARQDIYLRVAKLVQAKVSHDAIHGDEETRALAQQWIGKVGRKTVKRAVMTTPYGVTERGISDQIRKDGHVKAMDDKSGAAAYMRDRIVEALEQTVVSAKQIMAWLQTVAITLSRNGIPFRFTTPCGSTVQQSYFQLKQHRINTLVGKLVVWHEDKIGGLNDRKQFLASAPNVIHSFDASHMVKTILRMEREGEATGEEFSWSVIHDSYGVHACDVDLMHRCIREEFVAIYSDNWLQRIEDEVRSYAPDANIPPYKDFITLGDFNIEETTRSPFFFA